MKTIAEIIVDTYDALSLVPGEKGQMRLNGKTVSFIFERDVEEEIDNRLLKTATATETVPK